MILLQNMSLPLFKNRSNNITSHLQINETGWIKQGANELDKIIAKGKKNTMTHRRKINQFK
jgi:ribosomal protein L17